MFEGCNSYDGIGADPYGRLSINDVQRKRGAKGTGGHFRVEIFDDKALTQLIARIDGGPSAGIVGGSRSAHGDKNTQPEDTPSASLTGKEYQIQQMNHLLGNILLKQYMAEANEDWDLVNELKIKADALILQIRSLKNAAQ